MNCFLVCRIKATVRCSRHNCFELKRMFMNCPLFVGIKATVRCPRHNCFELKRTSHALPLLCPNQSNSSKVIPFRDTTASSVNESLMNCPFSAWIKATVRCPRHNCFEFKRKSHELSLCVGIKATVRCSRHNCFEFTRKTHELSLCAGIQSNSSLLETQLLRVLNESLMNCSFVSELKATVRVELETQLLRV